MTKHLITSALPYINGTKHLGNLAGSLLPADVHARHLRQSGQEVLFVCGTDEHGTPAEIAAAAAGLTPREFCDREHLRHREIYKAFGLSFDRFGRTSDPANHDLTQRVFFALEQEGFIEERETWQFWSAVDGRFLPDRYILGTCPRCGYSDARGDQCDACSATLDPTDLGSPRSAISGAVDLERDAASLPSAIGAGGRAGHVASPALRLVALRGGNCEGMARPGASRPLHHSGP